MPGKGFPPMPTAEKLARGETRPSRVNYDEPKIEPPTGDELQPPEGLDGAGRKEWTKQIDRLATRGVLTAADLSAFEDYCRAFTNLREWEERVRCETDTKLALRRQNMVLKLRAQVNVLRRECGLTPSSRSQVRVTTPMKGPGPANPAERYLRVLPNSKPTRNE
jgi:P27 family predicted phage terminase small subunit